MAGRQATFQVTATTIRVVLTDRDRQRYVRWWIECSGLTKAELRRIATGMWADRVFEETVESLPPAA